MRRQSLATACLLSVVLSLPHIAAESKPGRIDGRVADTDGRGQGGVTVAIQDSPRVTLTDGAGAYAFSGVPAGTYTLLFTLGESTVTEEGVVVTPGQTANVDVTAAWEIAYAEVVTVYAASRRVERIVDAPAAISVVSEQQIERQAGHAQLPKLLEFAPGVEVTQSGLYDYNLNTRGFNSSLNRRVATLIDGRDPSVPFLGAQEWAALSFPLDDLAGIELLRGPSAALYGKNASSGMLNLTTKQPRYSEGGFVRLTAGELSTTNVDFRWTGHVFADWYVKVVAGSRSGGDFSQSRNGVTEYSTPCLLIGQTDCLPQEVPLARVDDNQIRYGGLRVDKYWGSGSTLTLEGGLADIAGPLFQTGMGRVQLLDVQRPWARARWSDDHWYVQVHYMRRDAPRQLLLATGLNLALDTERLGVEAQTHWRLASDRLRLVFGGSHTTEELDSFDPVTGGQSLLFEPVDGAYGALFGQANYRFSKALEGVLAARWDSSSLHASQVSPKAALVWNPAPDHTLRLTYNEAFQVANYMELFQYTSIAAFPIGGFVTSICESPVLPQPIDCGIDDAFIPILAVGNDDLQLEKTKAWEVGYSGLLTNKIFVTVDYYNSDNENFITDLVPQLGTTLGNLDGCADALGNPITDPTQCPINTNFGPWVGSPEAETTVLFGGLTVADALRISVANSLSPLGMQFSSDPDGAAIVIARTYTNFGDVDTQGLDVGLKYYFSDDWNLSFSYSWFDFEIQDPLAGQLLPNSPENTSHLGLTYSGNRFDATLRGRWTDEFRWAVGLFQGDVPAYTTVDLNANYRLGTAWKTGVTIANLLDNVHYESFGGDLLGRRALGYLTFSW
ncbi:MAG: TonB-dependent receptor [Acidobacteria bacterium]|nr:MAG: TonB-dependent receptor [Acidobacteriota bacterium]